MEVRDDAVYNKTMDRDDFMEPPVRSMKKELSRFSRKLFFKQTPFAVNGFLRKRYYVRWYKMWEYARSLAYLDIKPGEKVLDFGGGSTLPVFWLAGKGCEVVSADINKKLAEHTSVVAKKNGWKLKGTTINLCESEAPAEWGSFNYVISFCTVEHLEEESRQAALKRLSGALADGGIMALTFDYGEEAPTENPLRNSSDIGRLITASGLEVVGNKDFIDAGIRFKLKNRKEYFYYTFGSLFLKKT